MNDENVTFVFLMIRHETKRDRETMEGELRDHLYARYGSHAQLQVLGHEDAAVEELRHIRQRILERRQRESQS